jgi:DNA (cytosine-5)-methyltransferase 1
MVARLQGFPNSWEFAGRKTAAYRQVGNAFPPPVARAFGVAITAALSRPPADEAHVVRIPAWRGNAIQE